MKVPYEAREAGLAALNNDKDWHKPDSAGVWRANYHRAVELVLEAAAPLMAQPEQRDYSEAEVAAKVADRVPHSDLDGFSLSERLRIGKAVAPLFMELLAPYMGVRPVVDREAVRRLLFDWIGGLGVDEGAVADAVMDLLTGGGSEAES